MTEPIRLDMRLARLFELYPTAAQVFKAHGLDQLASEETLASIGPFLTLKTALINHNIEPENFLALLKEHQSEKMTLEAPDQLDLKDSDPANLLALMTCGLKFPFSRALAEFMNDLEKGKDAAVTYSVVSNLNHEHSYYPYVNHIKTIDELPDVIISSDFNAFFYHRFYNDFIRPGHFEDVMDYAPNTLFDAAGIIDPKRQYTMLCVNPLIIVADLKKTGDRPLPNRWSDLLDPIWKDSITLRGNENFFCHAVLLPIFKEHGSAGIKALAENILDGRHPAQMVKSAGGGQSAALYVMPYFFSRKIPSQKPVQLIWPEDGALASPVALLVKKDKRKALKPIVDYLMSKELAQIFADAFFPSPHPDISHQLPDNAGLKWIGWDFIHANDLEEINGQIDEIFLPAVKKKALS